MNKLTKLKSKLIKAFNKVEILAMSDKQFLHIDDRNKLYKRYEMLKPDVDVMLELFNTISDKDYHSFAKEVKSLITDLKLLKIKFKIFYFMKSLGIGYNYNYKCKRIYKY